MSANNNYNFYTAVRIILFMISGILFLGLIVGLINDFDSYVSIARAKVLLIITIAFWALLNFIAIKYRPYFPTKSGGVRIKRLGREYQFGFLGIVLFLGAYCLWGTNDKLANKVLQEAVFNKKDSVLKVIVLPFKADIKSKTIDVDYAAQLKEYLQNIKNSGEYTFKIFFANPDSLNIPATENDAIKIGEKYNADLVIWGSFEEKADKLSGLRVRYVLTGNYHSMIDSSKRTGDTEMQSLSTLSQLRRGYLLNNVQYILNWTEGISAYQKYNFDRAIKYFERAKKQIDSERYKPSVNILLANLYQELGKESAAYLYCQNALEEQAKFGDTTSPFYAYLLLCSGSNVDKYRYPDSAFYFIQKGIKILKNKTVKDSLYLGIGYTELGKLYYDSGKPDTAAQYYTNALSFLNEANRDHVLGIIVLYYNIGIIKSDFQLQDEGLVLLKKALKLQDLLPQPDIIMNSFIFAGLGSVYSQKNFDSSMKYYRLANEILSTSLNNYSRRASLLSNIGNLFSYRGSNDSAKKYIQEAKDIMINNMDTVNILYAEININLSEVYKKYKRYPIALALEFEAEKTLLKMADSNFYPLAIVYINIADISCEADSLKVAETYLLKAWKVFLNNTLNSKNSSIYNPLDANIGYYYWTKAKIEKKKNSIINATDDAKKALQIFLHQNYPSDYKDLLELKKFISELSLK